ncbi:hypothetical protein [Pseudomonas syringae]|nr:hypothetical protein [Pseudomonas syringae]
MPTKTIQISFPPAQRVSGSDPKLYSFATVPSMDSADEDYVLHLTVRAGDPEQEQALADSCTQAINSASRTARALQLALHKLDSVAFLETEGDTELVKQVITSALDALGAPAAPLIPPVGIKRTKARIETLEVGQTIEVEFPGGSVFATVEWINEGRVLRTLGLCDGRSCFELSVEHGFSVTLVG